MKKGILLVLLMGISLTMGYTDQGKPIIGILPDTRNLAPGDSALIQACAEGIRIAFTRRGYPAVAPYLDETALLIMDEINTIGDASAIPFYDRLANLAASEEFLLLRLQGLTLYAEWRDARGATKGGGSVRFRTSSIIESSILADIMDEVLMPQLMGIRKDLFDPMAFVLPGFRHIQKGHKSGTFMAAAGILGLGMTGFGVIGASVEKQNALAAPNTTTEEYHNSLYLRNFTIGMSGLALFVLDGLISGFSAPGLRDTRFDAYIYKE